MCAFRKSVLCMKLLLGIRNRSLGIAEGQALAQVCSTEDEDVVTFVF